MRGVRRHRKIAFLCACFLGSVSLLLCMMQTQDINAVAMDNKMHIQADEQLHTRANRLRGRSARHSSFQHRRLYKSGLFAESVQIIESNLHHKIKNVRPVRKPKGIGSVKWLGEDNEIIEDAKDGLDKRTGQEPARSKGAASQINLNGKKRKKPTKTSEDCLWFDGFHSTDFLHGADSSKPLTWFSQRDRELVKFLAGGIVLKAGYHTRGEETVRVLLSINNSLAVESSGEQCRAGACGLVKELSDLWEVSAFHLDRILGLNISQPVVARRLRSHLLPQQYVDGSAKPMVLWEPWTPILQGTVPQQDAFHMAQFPSVFRKCREGGSEVCVRDNSPELQKMKLLNYFFQDVEIILASFNKGKEKHTVTFGDLDWIPPRTLKIISSQCLSEMLLRSLYEDQEYWQSKGTVSLLKLVDRISKRAQVLLQHFTDKHMQHRRPDM
ncbi:Golgi-associated kinase 1A-like [Amblyraja radiata]|uniref:Golgi-associated kinase 1A-like n=1 Tax=Amblyraja radiata TaxID=386614 RepID=UPI001403F643|nr:Golgi-associated kinase 1A-like [Amblyraja radiata]XP_032892059.1 Golgi-associated kinase 1A-like [Amblyraja radiata]